MQPTEQNTLTHTSAVSWRRLVNAAWSAPANFTGRVVFRATLVEEYRVRIQNMPLFLPNFTTTNLDLGVINNVKLTPE